MKILFVCTGNTCRSPMAEAVFNMLCQKDNKPHLAFSRGLCVFMPQKINQKAQIALDTLGIKKFSHISEMLSSEDIKDADMVLTMTAEHKISLKNSYPEFRQKIFTLSEKAYGRESDIADPYGLSQEQYNSCVNQIRSALENILCTI